MTLRSEKVREYIKHLAAEFLERESDRTTMITVTDARVTKNFSRAIIFFTVFPEEKEEVALSFAKRHRSDLKDYAKKKLKMKRIPSFDFAIDKGEKNRQLIDELSRN